MKIKDINILMCGSDFSVAGGMVSVAKSYLNYNDWKNNINYIYVPTHKKGSAIFRIVYFLKSLSQINRIIKRNNIHIAHLNATVGGSFFRKSFLLFFLKRKNIKVILQHHSDYSEFYYKSMLLKKKFILKVFEKADLNLVLGNGFEKILHSWSQKINVKVLYNGVHTNVANKYNSNAFNILFLGWLIPGKGIADFLEAIKILDSTGMDMRVGVYLCGENNDYVKELINAYGIQHRIKSIGYINNDEKKNVFSDVFVNVLPSYLEGLPLSILETMSYGIPNIASNIAAIPEIIKTGVNGYLIIPGDVQSIAFYIRQLLNNKDVREKMSEQAKDTIQKKFDLELIVNELEEIYVSLLV